MFTRYGSVKHATSWDTDPDLVVFPGSGADHWPLTPNTASQLSCFFKCKKRGVPMTGICAGHQLGGLAMGGRLWSLPNSAYLSGTSQLYREGADYSPAVNVSHHQYITHLDEFTLDFFKTGDINMSYVLLNERIPFLGVQWHPEWHTEGEWGVDYYHELLEGILK